MELNLSNCKHTVINEYEVDGVGSDVGKKLAIYKCADCGMMSKNRCEIYSRVVGYLTPTSGWNKGKAEEFKVRKTYKVDI